LSKLLALPDDSQPALRLMPQEFFAEILQTLGRDPSLNEPDRQAKLRFHSSRAFDCQLDSQGRLLLPADYIAELQLSGRVSLIGVWRHIEVWPTDRWTEHFHQLKSAHAAGTLRLDH
jgi:MraZ protein